MLAGIYAPSGRHRDETTARFRAAFGDQALDGAHFAGPLAIVSDRGARSVSDGGPGCVVEGPIYNLPEVAAELGQPASRSASELLTLAYDRWGDGFLTRLRGSFALAAWSSGGSRILLAQDQVGAGALFTYRQGDGFAFASEICHLLALLPRTPSPDETALVRWIALTNIYDGRTMYEGVRRLGAGHRMSITGDGVDVRRYWTPAYEAPLEGSRLEVAAQFRDAVLGAVDLRTRDVETVGITLSGGFDSSVVAAAAGALKRDGQRLRGYSTVFLDEPRMDDTDLLDALVKALPLENVRYRIEPGGMLAMCLMYARDWKLPLSGPGWIVERPFMEQAASDGVEVMLDGQGGDEVFGMAIYLLADRLRSGRWASAVELARHGIPGAARGAPWRVALGMVRQYGLYGALPHMLSSALDRRRELAQNARPFLNERAARTMAETTDRHRWTKGATAPLWWEHMRYLLIDDREATGLGDFVRQRSQWVGIESRPPLFDVDLISTALRLPPELGFDAYLDRPLAREAVAGILPDAVRLSRRKSNLVPFYHRGLTTRDLPLLRTLLGADQLEITPWVRPEVVRGLVDNPPATRDPAWYTWLNAVWGCVSAECWLRSLADPSFPERTLARPEVARLQYEVVG